VRVLGLESSCDETAAAIVDADGRVLSDVVRSQIALHAAWGGVVPELAARDHLRAVVPVTREACRAAGLELADLDGLAVTVRPGLAGALLVGAQFAKALALATNKPLVGVDHLVGHLLAVFLARGGEAPRRPGFPFVALVASGGHTAIYRVAGPLERDVEELGGTRDDAAGEAFDKVAKALGLGYPGGPVIDRLASGGDASRFAVPTPMQRDASLELSFSGVKTWIARLVEREGAPSGQALADLCASFQRAVVGVLVDKTTRAARGLGVRDVVLAGGVASNRGLRAHAAERCAALGLELFVPPPASCTDNAAMIAYAGAARLVAGERDELSLSIEPRSRIPRATVKGRGRR